MDTLIRADRADRSDTPAPIDARPARAAGGLSPREVEALALIAKGFTTDESARLMRVSRHTVVTFVRRLYLKLGARSKAEALFEARQLGLLEA